MKSSEQGPTWPIAHVVAIQTREGGGRVRESERETRGGGNQRRAKETERERERQAAA